MHCRSAIAGHAHIFSPAAPKPTPNSLLPSWQALIDCQGASAFVTVYCDAVIGVAAATADDSVPTGVTLTRLYVDPDRWAGGHGGRLHDHALLHARNHGWTGINLWVLEANRRARDMYERRGWQFVPGPTLTNDEPGVLDVLYERQLR